MGATTGSSGKGAARLRLAAHQLRSAFRPASWRSLARRRAHLWPPVGWVRFGSLRRVTPISNDAGWARGGPVDRWYLDRFCELHASSLHGSVLEVGGNDVTRRYGRGVTRSDVCNIDRTAPGTTVTADLSQPGSLPEGMWDAAIVLQTLQYVPDLQAAGANLHRCLRPGGVVLATLPAVAPVSPSEDALWGDRWRFTRHSACEVFAEAFGPEQVTIEPLGNVLSTVAFLHGLSARELSEAELDHADPSRPLLFGVVARRLPTGNAS